ncbi:hypothetical protein HY17_01105 [Hyphomonas sp. CY54-11-8]|nr:hypothetical protein HY17_01105 [Hyphomonas sp. CY54-11-8]
MQSEIVRAFEDECLMLKLDDLVPSKLVSKPTKATKKFEQICCSIAEVGLVEPIVVHRIKNGKGKYLILDGHMRVEALQDAGETEVTCLVSSDDEGYTYNKRVNRLSTVQEHFMVLRAIDNGVSEKKIAKALGLNIESIRRKRDLLKGICSEAVDILKDAKFAMDTAGILRRMTPIRQIEVAELMVATNNYSSSYAKALLVATKSDQLLDPTGNRSIRGVSDDDRRKMEREVEELRRDIKSVEDHYGTNMLKLVVASGYISRLLDNGNVSKYLDRHHQELRDQLYSLQESIDADLGANA